MTSPPADGGGITTQSSGPTLDDDRPRYTSAPPRRPDVHPTETQTFGRPVGVAGSFLPRPSAAETEHSSVQTGAAPAPTLAPPDPVLREAFSRPEHQTESLQRDPHAILPGTKQAEPAHEDPWRDPAAVVSLGDTARKASQAEDSANAGRLGAREVLFGSKVSVAALAVLGAFALLIGAIGGFVGRYTAEFHDKLTDGGYPKIQLAGSPPVPNSQAVQKIAAAVAPAVVTIETVFTSGSDKMEEIGSGAVFDKNNGYIFTNNHVVESAADPNNNATLTVIFNDGHRVPGRIVGRDPKADIAVVKVDANNLTELKFANPADVHVGEEVIAFGAPLGLSKTVTSGIVSALHRARVLPSPEHPDDANAASVIDAIQTDAAINHGNSGGPLVDLDGHVVGINTMIISPNDSGSIGLGFAIPSDDVAAEVTQLVRTGSAEHPVVGVMVRGMVNEQGGGVQVTDVVPGSPADRGGIKPNDVVVKIGDRTVSGIDEFMVAVRKMPLGKPSTVTVLRGEGQNKPVELQVTPDTDKKK